MSSEKTKVDLRPLEINKEFLEDLFGHGRVSSFTLIAGSNPGDNYMSIMHAVEINFTNGEKSHILIKCLPNQPTHREFVDESNVFKKEFFVYDFWIPKLQKMQEEIGVNPPVELPFAPYVGGKVANPILVDNDDAACKADDGNNNVVEQHDYIVMTDMRTSFGFKMADRCVGADYDHCRLVVEELAKIHAFSWAYKQRNKIKLLTNIYPNFEEDMFTGKTSEQFRPMMIDMMKTCFNTIEKGLGSDSPAYLGALKLETDNYTAEIASLVRKEGPDEEYLESRLRIKPAHDPNYNSEPWLLGCHGDCWLNNMLFKYDEETGKPEKVTLVDLQLYREGCPTTDLIYFFFTSTTSETRRNHEEALIRLYHDKFLEYCTELKCEPLPGFNLSSLKRRFRNAKVMGFLWSMQLLTVVLKEPEKVINIAEMDQKQDANEMFSNILGDSDTNTILRKRLSEMTQELYEDGVL